MRGSLLKFFGRRRESKKIPKTGETTVSSHDSKPEEIYSPDGLQVTASCSSSEIGPRRSYFNEGVQFFELEGKKLFFSKCGHTCSENCVVHYYGKKIKTNYQNLVVVAGGDGNSLDDICPRCVFEKMKEAAVRCCLCGIGIWLGDGVALYTPESVGVNEAVATYVEGNVVACLQMNCCPSGSFFAGCWTLEGFKSCQALY